MMPLVFAINDWTKSRNKNIVKNINYRYSEANKYFFGHK